MKNLICIFFFSVVGSRMLAADTTRVLFVGNSFTYYYNMPQIVKAFADSAKINMVIGMHAPGGVSVGDTAQGNMAHMNNPVLYALIRSKKWDVVVIQDNQGRFVRDSAVFSGASKVVEGHLKIMDSVKKNNSCAKIVLFGGWAFKNGSPPFGNTGIEMIDRILVNYCVLNDTMKEIIAPIGEAWKKAIIQLPGTDLWDPDQAHPSYPGSYLTASVIFSTITGKKTRPLNMSGTLTYSLAQILNAYSDTVCFETLKRQRFNMNAINTLAISENGGVLMVPANYASVKWFKNNLYAGSGFNLQTTGNGNYSAEALGTDGTTFKSCQMLYLLTAIKEKTKNDLFIFPNPASSHFSIRMHAEDEFSFFDCQGRELQISSRQTEELRTVNTSELTPGIYFVMVKTAEGDFLQKIMIE
jgi:hypothetical protein